MLAEAMDNNQGGVSNGLKRRPDARPWTVAVSRGHLLIARSARAEIRLQNQAAH